MGGLQTRWLSAAEEGLSSMSFFERAPGLCIPMSTTANKAHKNKKRTPMAHTSKWQKWIYLLTWPKGMATLEHVQIRRNKYLKIIHYFTPYLFKVLNLIKDLGNYM